jgi:hypothetical protein
MAGHHLFSVEALKNRKEEAKKFIIATRRWALGETG